MHPAERYLGVAYDADTCDCADFVSLVRLELHGHEVAMPNGRPRGRDGQAALGDLSRPYGDPTDNPQDGDLVLMKRGRGLWHVGLFYRIAGEDYVLHSMDTETCSVLHKVRELPLWGLKVEGVYSWR